jgi:hypothetical protein
MGYLLGQVLESATNQSSAMREPISQHSKSQIAPLKPHLRINIKDPNTMGKLSFCIGRYTYIHPISRPCRISPTRRDDKKIKLNSLNDSTNNSSTDTFSAGSHRLYRGSVGVDGSLGLGSVGTALGLLALLVRLVDGDGVPGLGVGHAGLLVGDVALEEIISTFEGGSVGIELRGDDE